MLRWCVPKTKKTKKIKAKESKESKESSTWKESFLCQIDKRLHTVGRRRSETHKQSFWKLTVIANNRRLDLVRYANIDSNRDLKSYWWSWSVHVKDHSLLLQHLIKHKITSIESKKTKRISFSNKQKRRRRTTEKKKIKKKKL